MDDNGFDAAVAGELDGLRDVTVNLEIDGLTAWIVLAQLQLALRHPRNTGRAAAVATQVARDLQRRVAADGLLARVAEMGWNPAYDG